jgi:hypothetical protein
MAVRIRGTLFTVAALAAFVLALGAPQRWFH